ncbi:amidase signature domain-containing protein [Amylocystis lapponica]|nr:amidase signature domain-containing protein [Amylocystis lapponica]
MIRPRWRGSRHAPSLIRHSSSHGYFSGSLEKINASVNALVSTASVLPPKRTGLPLSDFTVAIKDNICTSNMPTTCSSAMLQEFTPPFDATVVQLLQDNGARIIGKTNCDEFGMGSLNVHSLHGPVVNPHAPPGSPSRWAKRERRSAGGSSGGSAAAVAAKMCTAALATDTGGSIRLPASYCGVVGFKPSYGLISRWGVISYADSLDCVGIMARTVHRAEKMFDTLSVYDARDSTAAKPETRERVSVLYNMMQQWRASFLPGIRIGIPQEYFPSELQPEILQPFYHTLSYLQANGAELIPVSLPSTPYALSAYYVISSAEASSNMARYDGIQYGLNASPPEGTDTTKTANVYAHSRSRGFGKEVQKRILLGTHALSADAFDNYFLQAQRVRKLVRADFDRVFRTPNVLNYEDGMEPPATGPDRVHVLLHPSAIRTAPPLPRPDSPAQEQNDELSAYVQDVLTVPASLAGLPALSVPGRLAEDGWPVGITVVGQWGCDKMVLNVGKMCELAVQ